MDTPTMPRIRYGTTQHSIKSHGVAWFPDTGYHDRTVCGREVSTAKRVTFPSESDLEIRAETLCKRCLSGIDAMQARVDSGRPAITEDAR